MVIITIGVFTNAHTLHSWNFLKKYSKLALLSTLYSHEGHTKSKTGAISGSTNWALVKQKFKNKTKQQLCIPIHFMLPPSFNCYDVSKCEIRFEKIPENYISRLQFQGSASFLMAKPNQSCQCWHSCVGWRL